MMSRRGGNTAEETNTPATVPPTEETRASTALTVASDYAEDAGAGFEDVSSDELLIPFIRILQPLSSQCDEGSGSYIEGARPGMIITTATGELWSGKTGFLYLPVRREHHYVEFVPREAGGGFVGIWSPADPRIAELKAQHGAFGKLPLASGNELIETYSLYGLALPLTDTGEVSADAGVIQGVIGFASTQIKAYKMITTRLMGLIGSPPKFPLFAHAWHIRTVSQKNRKGSYYGWSAGLLHGDPRRALLRTTDPLYLQARDFFHLLRSGAAKADFAASGANVPDEVQTGGGEVDPDGDHIPF